MSVNIGIKMEKKTTVVVNLQHTAYHKMLVVGQVTHANTEESIL